MIVVEILDAVLVVHKDKTQDMKLIVDMLEQRGRSEGKLHPSKDISPLGLV